MSGKAKDTKKGAKQKVGLFSPGEPPHLNACVGDNGGPYDFADYAHGFFLGGDAAVEAAINGGIIDGLVYPAAFAYRHGIELYIKHLIDACNAKLGSNLQRKRVEHNLMTLWKLFYDESAKHTKLFNPRDIISASEIITEFNQIDPNGEVFRYPEDLKGNKHLTSLKLINVTVLKEHMETLHNLLQLWQYELGELSEHQ